MSIQVVYMVQMSTPEYAYFHHVACQELLQYNYCIYIKNRAMTGSLYIYKQIL